MEYSPELIHIHDTKNVAADALSRLVIIVDTFNGLEDEDISHLSNYKTIV